MITKMYAPDYGDEIYEIFSNGVLINSVAFNREIKSADQIFTLDNNDEIFVEDFLDSSGNFVQLRVAQITPRARDEKDTVVRDKTLLFFAGRQEKKVVGEETKVESYFDYIGMVSIDDNFDLVKIHEYIHNQDLNNVLEDYKDSLRLVYGSFDGTQISNPITVSNIDLKVRQLNTLQSNLFTAPVSVNKILTDDDNKSHYEIDVNGQYYGCYESSDNYYLQNLSRLTSDIQFTDGSTVLLSGHKYRATIIEGTNPPATRTITLEPLDNYLCLYDTGIKDKTEERPKETWSILFLPYEQEESLNLLTYVVLKDVSSKINSAAHPILNTTSNNGDYLELYNIENEGGFVALKSKMAIEPTITNFDSLEGLYVPLNGDDVIDDEGNIESEGYNADTWPINNKKLTDILSLRKIYYSFDREKWYSVHTVLSESFADGLEKRSEFIIDLNEEVISKKESVSVPSLGENDKEFLIQDKGKNTFNGNGNILLQAGNTISISIMNNKSADDEVQGLWIRVYDEEVKRVNE